MVFHSVEKSAKVFTFRGKIGQSFYVPWKNRPKFLRSVEKSPKVFTFRGKGGILPAMNTVVSAAMILWIFGMVIYLTKDM